MIHLAMESDVSAENASRLQQTLGKPCGFPTDSTASTTTRYSRCPPKRGRSTRRHKEFTKLPTDPVCPQITQMTQMTQIHTPTH